jgi:hypothetical protein
MPTLAAGMSRPKHSTKVLHNQFQHGAMDGTISVTRLRLNMAPSREGASASDDRIGGVTKVTLARLENAMLKEHDNPF